MNWSPPKITPLAPVEVSREMIFQAMKESGFARTHSCCAEELMKMCNGDQYKGNLEGFSRALVRLVTQAGKP